MAAYPFLGTFGALTAIYLMAFVLLTFLPLKAQLPAQISDTAKNRPYRQLYSQPLLILIAVVSAARYALVVYMVGAFPLAMKAQGFEFRQLPLCFSVIYWECLRPLSLPGS